MQLKKLILTKGILKFCYLIPKWEKVGTVMVIIFYHAIIVKIIKLFNSEIIVTEIYYIMV